MKNLYEIEEFKRYFMNSEKQRKKNCDIVVFKDKEN